MSLSSKFSIAYSEITHVTCSQCQRLTATKGTLKLFEPVTVQGKQLAPGQYTVEWNGEGPNVQLSIASGKNAVASVSARVVPVSPKNATSGYSSTKQQDGSSTLTNVFFQGKTFELQIADQSASQEAAPASGSNQ